MEVAAACSWVVAAAVAEVTIDPRTRNRLHRKPKPSSCSLLRRAFLRSPNPHVSLFAPHPAIRVA